MTQIYVRVEGPQNYVQNCNLFLLSERQFIIFLRFGKHRKALDSSLEEELQEAEQERNEARLSAQAEYQKIQEQYRRLQQQQQMQQQNVSPSQEQGSIDSQPARKMSSDDGNESTGSRTQRINQLRQQHQRRHVERQGQYPLEQQQEQYEHLIRQVSQLILNGLHWYVIYIHMSH